MKQTNKFMKPEKFLEKYFKHWFGVKDFEKFFEEKSKQHLIDLKEQVKSKQ